MEKPIIYIDIYSERRDIYKRGSLTETVNKVVSRKIVIRSIEKTSAALDAIKAAADVLDKLGYPVCIFYDYSDKEISKGITKRKMYYDGE